MIVKADVFNVIPKAFFSKSNMVMQVFIFVPCPEGEIQKGESM